MTKGINRSKLRDRRVGALVRLEEQKPKNEKHEKYIKREIERVMFNLDWGKKECKRPNLKNRKKETKETKKGKNV